MEKIKCIKFPKIEQFRNVVSKINRTYSYVGMDENENAIYDTTKPKPIIKFKGTVKLHGTNAAVSYNKNLGIWTQSRNNCFNLDSQLDSHMGFTFFVKTRKNLFNKWFKRLAEEHNINSEELCISIYGEWVGKGIQKGVAISEIKKSFFVFGVKISNPTDKDFKSIWINDYHFINSISDNIYNINNFKTYSIDIDFNNPAAIQNKLIEITNLVERKCPISFDLGHDGIGEGVVWSAFYKGNNYRFKVKGQKHSVSKVKKLAEIDIEKLNSIQDFVDYSVTKNRLEQALSEIFDNPLEYNVRKTGEVIRWIINDILAEEADVLLGNNLEPKDVNKYISTKAKDLFFEKLKF